MFSEQAGVDVFVSNLLPRLAFVGSTKGITDHWDK